MEWLSLVWYELHLNANNRATYVVSPTVEIDVVQFGRMDCLTGPWKLKTMWAWQLGDRGICQDLSLKLS